MLNDFHKTVLDKIWNSFEGGEKQGYVYLPTGVGKTTIIAELLKRELINYPDSKILILYKTQVEVNQFNDTISKHLSDISTPGETITKIEISTYPQVKEQGLFKKNNEFSLVVLFDAEHVPSTKSIFFSDSFHGKLLGVFSQPNIPVHCLFFDLPPLYLFDDNNTRFAEYRYINNLIIPLLEYLGFTHIHPEHKAYRSMDNISPDIIAYKDDVCYIIDFKAYRSINSNQQIINNAIWQIKHFKHTLSLSATHQCFGMILLCHVDIETKKALWQNDNIFIWDINNLLYLCKNTATLLSELDRIIPYSLNGITPEPPINFALGKTEVLKKANEESSGNNLIEELNTCKTGRKSSTKYERICTEIIKYLFETEFSQFSQQHKTNDSMFRMDILCSLKGTTAFWKMLINFYNTKFVVFEFKNYSRKLKQNLIYVTDKYLFKPALRNVAFIISRKGFDNHSGKAAMEILKESGKLIIDLTDDDLIKMILAKMDGNEPSDYLLDKVEKLLMSVSV